MMRSALGSESINEINEGLSDKDKITHRTFKTWKKNAKNRAELDEQGALFFTLIKKALRNQKKELFKKFQDRNVRKCFYSVMNS